MEGGRRPGQADSSLATRGKIIGLREAGFSQQEIAQRVGLSVSFHFIITFKI